MRWPATELADPLGIRYPLIQAPMAGVGTAFIACPESAAPDSYKR